jgi:cytidylate kinase
MLNNIQAAPVITIDGPGGSGKSTVGLRLAKKLGWHFLDSGALYRILALEALTRAISLIDEKALAQLATTLNIEILLLDQHVTGKIHTEACGNAASKIAVFPEVRAVLLEKQRAFCKPPGLIASGRDMGTVVFPHAMVKIFLEASASVRAQRRYAQLKDTDQNVTLQDLLEEISTRDLRDRGRVIAPLKPAEDAIVIDTTNLGIEAVLACVTQAVERCLY